MMFTFHLEACADPASLSKDTAHPAVVDMANKVKQAGMKVQLLFDCRCTSAVMQSLCDQLVVLRAFFAVSTLGLLESPLAGC